MAASFLWEQTTRLDSPPTEKDRYGPSRSSHSGSTPTPSPTPASQSSLVPQATSPTPNVTVGRSSSEGSFPTTSSQRGERRRLPGGAKSSGRAGVIPRVHTPP